MPSTLILLLFFKRKLQINHLPSLFLHFDVIPLHPMQFQSPSFSLFPRHLIAAETEIARNFTGTILSILLHSQMADVPVSSLVPAIVLHNSAPGPVSAQSASPPGRAVASSWFKSSSSPSWLHCKGNAIISSFLYVRCNHRGRHTIRADELNWTFWPRATGWYKNK